MKTVTIALAMAALLHVTPTVYGLPVSKADAIIRRAVPLDPTLFIREPSANLYDPRAFVTSSPDTQDLARRGSWNPLKWIHKSPDASQLSAEHMKRVKEQKGRLKKLKAELEKLHLPPNEDEGVGRLLAGNGYHLQMAEGDQKVGPQNPADALKYATKQNDDAEKKLEQLKMKSQYI